MSRRTLAPATASLVTTALVLSTLAVPAGPALAGTAGGRSRPCDRPTAASPARVPAAVRDWAGGDAVVGRGAIWTTQTVLSRPAVRQRDGSYELRKVAWYLVPAVGETPTITGRRVDGDGKFHAGANNAYSDGSWWAVSSLEMSRAGCWEITARYRKSRFTFRVPVPAGASVDAVDTFPVGGLLTDVALGFGSLWVPGDGVVHRIDPSTGSTVRDIRVKGASDFRYLAVAGGGVWVTDTGTERVTKIDPSTNEVVATVEMPGPPIDLAVARGRVWVAYTGDGEGLVPIDARSAKAGEPIRLTPRSGANLLAISVVADGDDVWVNGPDLSTEERATISARGVHVLEGEQPGQLVAAGRGALWFATDETVVHADPETVQPIGAPIPIAQAMGVAFTDDSVWVLTNRNSTTGGQPGQVWQLDPETLEVLGEPITVGNTPVRIRARDHTLWVANFTDSTITAITVGSGS